LGVLALSLVHGCGGGGGQPTTPTQILEQENNTFLSEVGSALEEALQGKQASIRVRKDNLTALLLDSEGSVVVGAAIDRAENLSPEQLARGADVLFIFVRGTIGSQLPSGFYIMRVSQEVTTSPGTSPAVKWRAQLRNLQGEVKAETDNVEVGVGNPNLGKPRILVSFEDGYVNFGYIGQGGSIIYRTRYTGGFYLYSYQQPEDSSQLPKSGQKIVDAAKRLYRKALEFIGADSSRPMILATSDRGMFIHAAEQGLENLTLEQLKKGAKISLMYWPPKMATIYLSQSPDGRWVAKLVDKEGNVVKEATEVIVEEQPSTQKVKLSIEAGGYEICVDVAVDGFKAVACFSWE
jgi:hypothetical protein